jgi:hypothetical protein
MTDGGEGLKNPVESTRQKMRQAKLGKKMGPRPKEICERIAKSHRGKKLTDSHRENLSKSHSHSVKCLNDNKTFCSLKEAANHYQITSSAICLAIKQNRKCAGLIFEKM